jgi:catechol 2,3-dioxygenase-like lactoylglutathione lyase family enzyme
VRPAAPLGQFLELALPTHDIAASVQFYERLGFTQRLTGDAWPHPYGVLGDGRLHLGLHQRPSAGRDRTASYEAAALLQAPTPCFVHAGLARQLERLRQHGLEPDVLQLGEESLHHLWLRDPAGHALLLQEARTFSPVPLDAAAHGTAGAVSLCGEFVHLSLPEPDFEAALSFWERAGFVGLAAEELPYAHQPLTSDQLDLAFHALRSCDAPLLLFEMIDPAATLAELGRQDILPLSRPPRGLQQRGNLILEAPEGTLLLLAPPRSGG